MPATEEHDGDAEDVQEALGATLAQRWATSARGAAQDWARAFRQGESLSLGSFKRASRLDASLDSVVWNKLSAKFTQELKRELGGTGDDFELPPVGSSPLATTRGFFFCVYRAAMPCTYRENAREKGGGWRCATNILVFDRDGACGGPASAR